MISDMWQKLQKNEETQIFTGASQAKPSQWSREPWQKQKVVKVTRSCLTSAIQTQCKTLHLLPPYGGAHDQY